MQLSRIPVTLTLTAGMLVTSPLATSADQSSIRIDYIELPAPEPVDRPPDVQWGGPTQMLTEMVAGEWSWTPQGHRIWRAGFRAPGARALRVHFEDFSTPGTVRLYARGRDEPVAGPYTGGGLHGDGSFWSGFVPGDAVVIEYIPAEAVPAADVLPFRVDGFSRITSPKFPVLTPSGKVSGLEPRRLAGCHLDASCFPEAVDRTGPAVALVAVTSARGSYYCTGFVINPRQQGPERLLMLTAGHCIRTREEARDAEFLWQYQTEECHGDPDWENWEERPVWTSGSELLERRDDARHDLALLGLDRKDISSATGGVWRLGWSTRSRRRRVGTEVFSIGHPDSGLKKISVGNIVSYRWNNYDSDHFLTVDWRLGTSEGGSSGSPLMVIQDGTSYVVGMHVGATVPEDLDQDSPWGPYCDSDLRAIANRFDRIYEVIEGYLENESTGPEPAPAPATATVALGRSGDTVTLRQDAEGVWWFGDSAVISGTTRVRASNGNSYILTLESNGERGTRWTATFVAPRVTVQLGTSNFRITLIQSEDGTWWQGTREATDGMTISTPAGKTYRLRFQDGKWTATEVSG